MIDLSNVHSIFVRNTNGWLVAAFYPNTIGGTVEELLHLACERAQEISGSVAIQRTEGESETISFPLELKEAA